MKKILITVLMVVTSYTMASAELGVNIGVSAQIGTMDANGKETSTSAAQTEQKTKNQEALFASGTYFIEKELTFLPWFLDRLTLGYDNMAHDIDMGTATNTMQNRLGGPLDVTKAITHNQVSATVDKFETVYMTARLTDWLYIKAGNVTVDVKTTEKLDSGGKYDDASLDGTMLGIGIHKETDTGWFTRLEWNDYDIDGVTLKNKGTDAKTSVVLSAISGETARISFGKAF